MDNNPKSFNDLRSEITQLALNNIKAEHDFIEHETNVKVTFLGSDTSSITRPKLNFNVEFDGPNSKYNGNYSISHDNNGVFRGVLGSNDNSTSLSLDLESIPLPKNWAGPAPLLQAVSQAMEGQDINNIYGMPNFLKKGFDDQFKIDYASYANKLTGNQIEGTYTERLNHQLAGYLETLNHQYNNFDGGIKTTLINTNLDLKAGDLLERARKKGITIDQANIAMLNRCYKSHMALSKNNPRFNDTMATPTVDSLNSAAIKASDYSAIRYFPPKENKVNFQDHILHFSNLSSAPIMTPTAKSSEAQRQAYIAHQQQTASCWKAVANELKDQDWSNRQEVRSIKNQLNWIPDAPWMKDVNIGEKTFSQVLQDTKDFAVSSFEACRDQIKRDIDQERNSPTP